jgi:hypothetical protein
VTSDAQTIVGTASRSPVSTSDQHPPAHPARTQRRRRVERQRLWRTEESACYEAMPPLPVRRLEILCGSSSRPVSRRTSFRSGVADRDPFSVESVAVRAPLPHADALVYTNRNNLPPEVAVKMSNTDLYNLVEAQEIRPENFNPRYADGLLQIKVPGALGRAGE